ncbi:NAD(P)-dependent alcohol dehydrogenase [Enterococcus sp. AZ196]|uniref:NAD(P)-dependent alcohol dehydrogenase n=1 Tax=Enterococcus sp. AZ196 TaxID=2774659 RepID=UPI003D2C311B
MKAIVCEKYGSTEHLKIKELSIPKVKENDILVRVLATTVASGDCVVKNASNPFVRIIFGIQKPRNPILGTDLAGIVEKVGSNVTRFNIGDHIVASTGMKFGGHAEYISLNQNLAISKIPEKMSFKEASVLAFGGNAALHYLRKMKKKSNSKILIYGASGAVGSSSIQLAKHFGLEVTAVCSSNNIDMVRLLGADSTLDYTKIDWERSLKNYDFIFDTVGKTKQKKWDKYLTKNGKFYTVAKGLVKENTQDLELLVNLTNQDILRPVIDRIYTIDEVKEAYSYVETGRKRGNVVLDFED